MGDVSEARPTAEGTLAARPLTHLLVYTRTRRLTGRLILRAPDGTGGAIALWNGQIAAARTAPPIAYFGSVASELGFVDAATAEATLRDAMERKRLHGEVPRVSNELSRTLADAYERYDNNRQLLVIYRDQVLPDLVRVAREDLRCAELIRFALTPDYFDIRRLLGLETSS